MTTSATPKRTSRKTKKTTARRRKATAPESTARRAGSARRPGSVRRPRGVAGAKPDGSTETMAAVPIKDRLAIDKALICETPPLADTEAVYEHFKVSRRYGVDRESFEAYARSVREVHAIGYADRLAYELLAERGPDGREAPMDLMTSRLARRIARLLAEDDEITVSELARLASAAASLRRAVTLAEKGRIERANDDEPTGTLSSKLRRAVRELYGLDLSADSPQEAKTIGSEGA